MPKVKPDQNRINLLKAGLLKDRQASPRSRNPLPLRLQDFYAEYLKGDPKSEGDYRTQRFVELALKDGICEKKAKRALNSGKVFPTSFIFVQLAQCSNFSQCNFHRQIPWISMSARGSMKTWHPRPSCFGDACVASSSRLQTATCGQIQCDVNTQFALAWLPSFALDPPTALEVKAGLVLKWVNWSNAACTTRI